MMENDRFYSAILEITKQYNNKKIAIFSHKNAISMLIMEFCVNVIQDRLNCYYNDKLVIDGDWDGTPEIFKIDFENDKLINIQKINIS